MPTSSQQGMGAKVYPGGSGFRVWAPFAQSVAVAGEFNGWSPMANPLTQEGNGYWSTDVPSAVVGQEYKYVLVHNGSPLWRNDPYAREVREANGNTNTLIHPRDYDWEGDP